MAVKTTVADRDSLPSRDSVRQQLNKKIADFYYFMLNRIVAATLATLPAVARATVASQVKITNATVFMNNGVARAQGATDNFWTLTGANLAAGFFRRYLLLIDAAGVASVQASTDAATQALCQFTALPAAGLTIAGILTIQNVTNPFIPGTTLLSAAGVTDTYMDGYDDSVFQSAQVTP
jgi:hypothetical protein